MSPRATLVLVVLAVLSLGLGWRFGPFSLPATQTTLPAGRLVFPGLAAQLPRAARVSLLHAGHKLVLTRVKGAWVLPDKAGYPARPGRLRTLFSGLAGLRITGARTAQRANYPVLGVESPFGKGANSTLLRVRDGAGEILAQLILGHQRTAMQGATAETVYIRRPGAARSWLAVGRIPLNPDPALWLRQTIVDISHKRLARVRIRRGAAAMDLAITAGKPSMTHPADHPKLDPFKLDEVARALEALTLSDVRRAAATPATPLGHAVFTTTDGLTITATVHREGKLVWARFAAAGTGKAAAEAAALDARWRGWSYAIGDWMLAQLVPRMSDLAAAIPTAPVPPMPAAPAAPTASPGPAAPAASPGPAAPAAPPAPK